MFQVHLSSVWLLPEEGYPVFYRYFRDRITWYEADAVCQFHHGHLVTIDTAKEFDAARAYLKELDVANFVWTGLKRNKPNEPFLWPESKEMMEPEGRWAVEIPKMEEALCAAIDPSADFRWQPLPCAGPTVAAFICQMTVPSWALNEKGCMLTSLPSLTVTYLPEQGAVELVSDCGLEGTRRIACKGQANKDEMMRQLACESPTVSGQTEAAAETTSSTIRHRRGSEATLPSVHRSTQQMGFTEEITRPTVEENTIGGSTEVVKEATTVVKAATAKPAKIRTTRGPKTIATTEVEEKAVSVGPGQVEIAVEVQDSGPISAVKRTLSSKPIPPSLKGNSPFLEGPRNTTEEHLPLESHELLGGDPEALHSSASQVSSVSPGGHRSPQLEQYKKNVQDSGEDHSEQATLSSPGTNQSLGDKKDVQDAGVHRIEEPPVLTSPKSYPGGSQSLGDQLPQDKKNLQDSGEKHTEEPPLLTSPKSSSGREILAGDQPHLPGRPNRGRLLVHPQHHSFYAYFLNRVLG